MEQLAFLDSTDLLPGLTKENPLHPGPEYQVPDLWVFSDYCPGEAPSWVESGVLHCDEKVEIKVVEKTEIHPLAKEMTFNVNPSYINLRPGPATGGCSI